MKTMNALFVLASTSLLLIGSSYAGMDLSGTCKKLEFAELKTYSKKELSKLYCLNEAYAKMNSDSGDRYSELALSTRQSEREALALGSSEMASKAGAQAKETSARADASNEKASACEAEAARIAKILKSKPKC